VSGIAKSAYACWGFLGRVGPCSASNLVLTAPCAQSSICNRIHQEAPVRWARRRAEEGLREDHMTVFRPGKQGRSTGKPQSCPGCLADAGVNLRNGETRWPVALAGGAAVKGAVAARRDAIPAGWAPGAPRDRLASRRARHRRATR
jgi:hypothetical protein